MAASADLAIVIRAQDQASQALRGISASLGGLGKTAQGIGGMLGQGFGLAAGMAGFQGLAGVLGGAKSAMIDFNASMEQSQVAFTTMLGSGEKADAFLKQLQQFAATTPFEFPELQDAAKRMLAFGIDAKDVIPTMTAVGDSVAALGGSKEQINQVTLALGQMKAKGRVQGDEMLQLAEAGIPAWDMLAKKIGVDIPTAMKMVSKGAVSAETFLDAFRTGAAERFGGMMEKQSQTFNGAMSTINDVVRMTAANAFKPFFEMISAGALALSNFLQSEQFTAWAANLNTAMAGLAGMLQRDVLPAVMFVARAFMDALPGALSVAQAALTPILGVLRILADSFTTVVQVFQGDWSPDPSQVQPFTEKIGELAIVLRDEVIPAVAGVIEWLSANLPVAIATAEAVLAALVTAVQPVVDAMPGLLATWQTTWSAIVAALSAAWAAVQPIIQAVIAEVARFATEMAPQAIAAWQNIQLGITTEANTILTTIQTVFGALSAFWQQHHDTLQQIASVAWSGIQQTISTQWEASKLVVTVGLQVLSGNWEGAWNTLRNTASNIWSGISGDLQGIWNGLTSAARNAGASLVSAFRDGVVSRLDALIDKVRDMVQQIRDMLPGSDAKEGPLSDLTRSGQALAETVAKGLRAGAPALIAVQRDIAAMIAPNESAGIGPAGGFSPSLGGGGGPSGGSVASAPSSGGIIWTGNVIVQGSVTTEHDLAAAVRDQLISMQRRGSPILA